MVKAKRSSMKVLRNLYVMALAGMWATLWRVGGVSGWRFDFGEKGEWYFEAVVDVETWDHH